MVLADRQPAAPGHFVPTVVYERRVVRGLAERVPLTGEAFVPDPLPPASLDRDRFIGRVSDELLAAQTGLLRLEGAAAGLPVPEFLLRPFQINEARLSSKIEDTVASVEELVLMDADLQPERDEVREVWNNLRALEHGMASPLPLCNRLLREMHAILLHGVRGEEQRPGEFRTVQVYIGDSDQGFANARFVPPPPGDVLTSCLHDFERFLNPAPRGSGTPTPARASYPHMIEVAMAHYQFECIHPFSDGNGRLGRLLVTIWPCKHEMLSRPLLYTSAFFAKHRQEYYDLLLRVSADGDWESWVRFFLRAVAEQAGDGLRRARHLGALRERFVAGVTTKRASVLAIRLVDLLFARPAISVTQAAKHLGVTVPAAQKHINRLIDLGVLTEATGGRYGRVYLAQDIVRAIEEESL